MFSLINLWYIFLAIFALGFSIFIHELGHFIAARKRGLVADRFSIGFGPRLFGWRSGGTDFRLSLLPLGGYVSLPQLADMGRLEGGEGEEQRELPPISYADKMIVAVMGAVFNLIFAFLISLLLWGVGRDIIKSTKVGGVAVEIVNSDGELVPGPAFEAGIRKDDIIREVDGRRIGDWWDFLNTLALGVGRTGDGRPFTEITVERGGARVELEVYPAIATSERMRYIGVQPETDEGSAPVITRIERDMPAFAAGLEENDRLLALDGEPIVSGSFLRSYLANHGDRTIDITVERGGSRLVVPVKPRIKAEEGETTPRFGFAYDYEFKTERVHYNPVEQLLGFADTMRRTLYALVHRGSNVGLNDMSGPVGIVHGLDRMARSSWVDLLWFLALINVNLGIFNLLPIPVLDGGHMTFATISKLIGRPLPRRLMESLQGSFMVLLLGLMLYLSFFDIGRVGRDIGLIKERPIPGESEPAPPEPEAANEDGEAAPANAD